MILNSFSATSHLAGSISVPGDKSISHRAIMLGAIANGETHVSGFLAGEDNMATLEAFRAMGVTISTPDNGRVTINGVGLDGLRAPKSVLDVGNSGTSIRLLMGLLAGQPFDTVLTGDDSLKKRPMQRVISPLSEMGANISSNEGCPPVSIQGGQALQGIRYDSPIASAQVKSAVLLAGLYASGDTIVSEPKLSRDHTENMLTQFGCTVKKQRLTTILSGQQALTGTEVSVPGDFSSACFFIVAGLIAKSGEVTIRDVGINPTRTGALSILQQMGGRISIQNQRIRGGEPIADLKVSPSDLKGIDIPEDLVPAAIDEFPIICIAAALAKGETTLTGAKELRVKESDRIAAMAQGLVALGCEVSELEDGMIITGGELSGGEVDSMTDHRIAMSFLIAGLRAKAPITVKRCENIMTSFPSFLLVADKLGLAIKE